jgi:hypothetical protein
LTKRIFQLAAAALGGAFTGLVIFTVTQVTGRSLYIIIGAAAGPAVALISQWYWQTAKLTEVTIAVPQVSELKFVVNNDARQVAWKLYIETVTRVSTQPLGTQEGYIRESLASLHGLFGSTRDTLKASRPSAPIPGGQTVEHLAITMLNHELRPFLTKWHPRLHSFELAHPAEAESVWPQNTECREDLKQVQSHLAHFALAFARLAGVRDAEAAVPPEG